MLWRMRTSCRLASAWRHHAGRGAGLPGTEGAAADAKVPTLKTAQALVYTTFPLYTTNSTTQARPRKGQSVVASAAFVAQCVVAQRCKQLMCDLDLFLSNSVPKNCRINRSARHCADRCPHLYTAHAWTSPASPPLEHIANDPVKRYLQTERITPLGEPLHNGGRIKRHTIHQSTTSCKVLSSG